MLNEPRFVLRRRFVALMLGSMRHRGPDGSGMASFSTAAFSGILGHTRLSILDLTEAADQPMRSGDDILVFNGREIYNFERTRPTDAFSRHRTSVYRGHQEVLLKSIALAGPDSIKDLRGMFAFAEYLGKDQALYLARDEFGIKPLYYYHRPDQGDTGVRVGGSHPCWRRGSCLDGFRNKAFDPYSHSVPRFRRLRASTAFAYFPLALGQRK